MNFKKILILTILFIAVLGFTLSTVSSVEASKIYSKNVKFNEKMALTKSIQYDNQIQSTFSDKYYTGYSTKMAIEIMDRKHWLYKPMFKPTKAKVYFKKKVNGKTVYSTKTLKANKRGLILYNPKNNFKPYKATVYYKLK